MPEPAILHFAVEDDLSEATIRALVLQVGLRYRLGTCFRQGGFGYLKKNAARFNQAAARTPFLLLTDLDSHECPPSLLEKWLPLGRHPNLIFRVAVREVEAWVMADRVAFAHFLGVTENLIPSPIDSVPDPKAFLIGLARRSPKRTLKKRLVPPAGSHRSQGPNYNGPLTAFVRDSWRLGHARVSSPSLDRAARALQAFHPA